MNRPLDNKNIDYINENEINNNNNLKATASRHMLFIRHGQYNLDAITDEEKSLTKKGKILLIVKI